MSSVNEHLLPPPKPKLSPLEFRNTDLVSRLLAATPPYLYNMSLLPNTYFFSEMLRSLVQAKNEQNSRNHQINNLHPPLRRSRKRAWSRIDNIPPVPSVNIPEPKSEQNHTEPWMLKSSKKTEENPLELTTKTEENVQNKTQFPSKNEEVYQGHIENNSNLVLPPPPPMWYPPIYPHTPPYGIDPLHFFIDLRVSGHIYDRKNQKESTSTTPTSTIVNNNKKEESNETKINNNEENIDNIFKQRRHCSAFSVPHSSKAINLSEKNETKIKFDVKSMGFDKSSNKTSTNYIMNNILNIYKNLGEVQKLLCSSNEETEENSTEKNKKSQDLKALIGLEFVVDYMNKKSNGEETIEDSNDSSDVESVGSPALEVVDIHEENN